MLRSNRHARCRALRCGAGRDCFLRTGRHLSAVWRGVPETHRLTPAQRKAVWAITHCRTAALGGHRQWCPSCGFERYTYHSCRNRHCPKCQSTATAAWVAARQEELLPVPYFHNVFTLPHELNPLILWSQRNQRALLGLLFDAVAQTLLEFGHNEFGGKVGFTLVLHTWDQQLRPHFHLHGLIASGALADDGSRWIAGGRQFLFPVRGLSKMFRAKYLDGLAELLERGPTGLAASVGRAGRGHSRRRWLRRCRKKPWVVYSQAPFAGPRKLLDYLGRYTHRVAISNHRILACRDGQVALPLSRPPRRRPAQDGHPSGRGIPPPLPPTRSAGPLPPHPALRLAGQLRQSISYLARCRQLLGARPPAADDQPQSAADWMRVLLGIDITRCPCCGKQLHHEIFRRRVPHRPMPPFTAPQNISRPGTLPKGERHDDRNHCPRNRKLSALSAKMLCACRRVRPGQCLFKAFPSRSHCLGPPSVPNSTARQPVLATPNSCVPCDPISKDGNPEPLTLRGFVQWGFIGHRCATTR